MSERRKLNFADTDAVAADIRRLRGGYTQNGNWSLPQICWHVEAILKFWMRPGPHAPAKPTAEQVLRLKNIFASGQLPDGINAPEGTSPKEKTPDSAIDSLLLKLEEFKNFKGPFAPHRLFGEIDPADFRRLNLIHCARHLSFLSPIQK